MAASLGGLVHAGHAADELAEGIEDVGVFDGGMTRVRPMATVPADKRRAGRGQSRALAKAEQKIVIGNVEEEFARIVILTFEAAVEKLDPRVIE